MKYENINNNKAVNGKIDLLTNLGIESTPLKIFIVHIWYSYSNTNG